MNLYIVKVKNILNQKHVFVDHSSSTTNHASEFIVGIMFHAAYCLLIHFCLYY